MGTGACSRQTDGVHCQWKHGGPLASYICGTPTEVTVHSHSGGPLASYIDLCGTPTEAAVHCHSGGSSKMTFLQMVQMMLERTGGQ